MYVLAQALLLLTISTQPADPPPPLPAGDPERAQKVATLLNQVAEGVVRPMERCNSSCRTDQRCPSCSLFMTDYRRFRDLADRLAKVESTWEIVGPRIEKTLQDANASLELRHGLLNLGIYAPSKSTRKWMKRLYGKAPGAFADGHLIALTAQGSGFFEKRLRERAREGRVRPAAYLTCRGSSSTTPEDEVRYRKVLIQATRKDVTLDAVLAAAALQESGSEEFWQTTKDAVRERVQRHVSRGELEAARRKTLEAECLFAAFRKDGPRGYDRGGWWGLNADAPFWTWKASAADHLGTEVHFYCLMKDDWRPDAEEILERIQAVVNGP